MVRTYYGVKKCYLRPWPQLPYTWSRALTSSQWITAKFIGQHSITRNYINHVMVSLAKLILDISSTERSYGDQYQGAWLLWNDNEKAYVIRLMLTLLTSPPSLSAPQ